MLGDGDEKAYAKLLKDNQYPGHETNKVECVSRVTKMMGTALWNLVEKRKAQKLPSDANRIMEALIECLLEVFPSQWEYFNLTATSFLSGIQKCVNLQLKAFRPSGEYGTPASEEEIARVVGSEVNNLGCERLFARLDSSINRRRHGTLHFHS
nr:hypothetical protein BaRGS_030667 [Batillaria attramentaria]